VDVRSCILSLNSLQYKELCLTYPIQASTSDAWTSAQKSACNKPRWRRDACVYILKKTAKEPNKNRTIPCTCIYSQPRGHGGFCELSPPNKAPSPPNW